MSQRVAVVPHWQQWGSERGAVSEDCVGGPGPGQLSCGAIWALGCPAGLPHLPLSSQAAGDTPTTPKHTKDSRENFFPVAVAPTAPDPVPAETLQRPSDTHTKPRPAPAATTAVITCPPSASVSTPDLSKDPGAPRPHRPESAPCVASLGQGEYCPVPLPSGV